MQNQNKSPHSAVTFKDDGSPFSQVFDDIYFDTQAGYSQSEHVFILGNNIEQRLNNNNQSLVIGETGFGTGLNFFITLAYYKKAQHIHQENTKPLTFISVEKYPLSVTQIKQSLACWTEFNDDVDVMCEQYARLDTNQPIHELSFLNSKVTLVLVFDDAANGLKQLTSSTSEVKRTNKKLISPINAWYLDGFTPAKNPQMWSDELFEQIARLSIDDASLATFTVAGMVKRGLAKVGFRLQKQETTARKNKSIIAKFQQSPISGKGYLLRPLHAKPTRVAIIGSGIAAACLAYKLTKENVLVTIYCEDEALAQGASSNAIGAVYPLLHQHKDEISAYYQHAFDTSLDFYQSLIADGVEFPHEWCGVLELAFKAPLEQRLNKFNEINDWPKDLIHTINAEQASDIAKIPLQHGGLFMPRAGWVAPQQLVRAIFKQAKATNFLKIKTGSHIKKIEQVKEERWLLYLQNKIDKATHVIMCGGAQTPLLKPFDQLPVYPVRGQVTSMRTNNEIKKLETVICHKGYLTPEHGGIHCIGATFNKDDQSTSPKQADDDYNLAMYQKCLPNYPTWHHEDIVRSKARLRCMSPDHLPLAGPMPKTDEYYKIYQHLEKDKNWQIETPAPYYNNLFVITGLGARGLCSAPLLADIVMADLCGTPYPVDSKTLFNLAPNRFIIKDIIKRKFNTA